MRTAARSHQHAAVTGNLGSEVRTAVPLLHTLCQSIPLRAQIRGHCHERRISYPHVTKHNPVRAMGLLGTEKWEGASRVSLRKQMPRGGSS